MRKAINEDTLMPNSSTDFIKSARDIAFIFAIYLYFTGWIYIYSYLNFFGLSIRQADIEFYYFLIYSVNVMTFLITNQWLLTSMFVLLCAGMLRFINIKWAVVSIGILLFSLLYYSAVQAGTENAKKDFAYRGSSLLKVKFVLKPQKDSANMKSLKILSVKSKAQSLDLIDDDFKKCNEDDSLKLLLDSKEGYLVLVLDTSATVDNALSKDKKIYEVKKENIELIRIIK